MFKSEYARKGAIDQLKFLIKIAAENRFHIDTVYDSGKIDQKDFDTWRRFNNDVVQMLKDEIEDIQAGVDY